MITQVLLPPLTLLSGKTAQIIPTGREGISPRITYGKETEGFMLKWDAAGTAKVTLPVTGNDSRYVGSLTLRMQAVAVMRHVANGRAVYSELYEDLKGNGLPEQMSVMPAEQVPGKLQAIFAGEGPSWLKDIIVSGNVGLSSFGNAGLHHLEGVYVAQVIPDFAELRLTGDIPARWRVSMPISVEYQ